MSVESFINRVKQRDSAVYWSLADPPTLADGSPSYQAPLSIEVIWREDQRVVKDFYEKEFISRANIYTGDDLEEQGMLYHGSLSDLSAEQKVDPRLVPEAYEIRRIMKVPSLAFKDKYMRKSYI